MPGDRFASIDRFVQLCKERVDKFARVQTEQSIRLGYWMDWDRDEDWAKPPDERRSYFTMSEENNYTIWSFLKKCHERGLIYRGYDSMPWCPRCGVGISQMEMNEGYQRVAHRAVFVRFPLRGRPGENLLVWTTTPWTLTSNVAAAVNPSSTYLKVQPQRRGLLRRQGRLHGATARRGVQEQGMGRGRAQAQDARADLQGERRLRRSSASSRARTWSAGRTTARSTSCRPRMHPGGYPAEIAEVVVKQKWGPAKPAREIHRVIAWEAVGEAEGTGIVHIAPGCGKEDFELGKEQGLSRSPRSTRPASSCPASASLKARSALDPATTDWILDNLQQKGSACRGREVSAQLSALLALQDGAALPPRR